MNNNYQGETLSFWELLKKQLVEIPIIQRDYAQGRMDEQEIRNNFLNALLASLSENKLIMLDFIYGSKENSAFQPLDGQQRLTTLFLLHWYAAIKDNILPKEYQQVLSKFSYETRISSREFCSSLVNKKVEVDLGQGNLSNSIIDSAWFFLSWKNDPTIDAMLRTIDDIHEKFSNVAELWQKLTSENGLIRFYHVNLEDIGLTDDLYIKMNARGKLLSTFENFKACFEKRIISNKWEAKKKVSNSFACKIDTKWTDLFWSHRKENSIDEAIIRFLSTIAMICNSVEKTEDRLAIISQLQDNPKAIKADMFNKIGFDYLCKCFDLYCDSFKNSIDLTLDFPLFQHAPEKNIFSSIVYDGQNASYTQKVMFFAQTEFLIRNSTFKRDSFLHWMRVIRNLVSRGDVTKNGDRPAITRSPQTFDGIINLIKELAEGSSDIYKFLSSDTTIKSTYAKEQIEEERLKARLINKNNSFKVSIFATEDTNLLQGRIDFALYCADFNESKENFDPDFLSNIQKVISNFFSQESHLTNDLRRALLTISDEAGNYNYYGYWWSFWNVVSANKRCLIDKFRELEFYIYGKTGKEFRIYIKKLIIQLMKKSLKQIIEDFQPPAEMPNWKIRLIKETNLLDDESKSNYIAIPNDESYCFLLKSIRPRDLEGCKKIE